MSLKQLVERDGPLHYRRAAGYVEQAATRLSELHGKGVLHREVRSAALILDETGRVTLHLSDLEQHESRTATDSPIEEGSILEVADYLAPEQALNSHRVDVRADIYSLGCTFYFLLTGHSPFPEGSISERLLKHQVAPAPSITAKRPDAPAALVHLCERMMSKKREDRPQAAIEVASVLREWLAGS
jgi:eukaryotic-like serine/threonine-protein kinase